MGEKSIDNRIIDLQRSREMLLEMISADKATFMMSVSQYQEEEYYDVRIEYEICGVQYEKERARLKLMVSLNSMDPGDTRLEYEQVRERMMASVAENCRFLLKDTYYVSFDRDSVRNLRREAKRREFKSYLDFVIRDQGFTMEEMLPIVMEFVVESLPETSCRSVDELLDKKEKPGQPKRMVLEITPPSVPCPHCNGLLSEKALRELMMKIYMRYHHRDDGYDN